MTYESLKSRCDGVVKHILESRELSEADFILNGGTSEIYRTLQDSKIGFIYITKVSDNPGYVDKGQSEYGVTSAFGENLSLYISGGDRWFRTSVIQKIYWDKGEFTTLNSRYKFEFEEIDYRPILEEMKNESTSNK